MRAFAPFAAFCLSAATVFAANLVEIKEPARVTASFSAKAPVRVVNVWATWCGPCQKFAPVINELAVELANRIRVAKLDVDQNPGTVSQFKVRTVPTLLFFNRGREIDRLIGVEPKSEILRRLECAIAA